VPEGDTIFRAARTLHRALAGRKVDRFESRLHSDATFSTESTEEGPTDHADYADYPYWLRVIRVLRGPFWTFIGSV